MRKLGIVLLYLIICVTSVCGTTVQDIITILNVIDFFIGDSEAVPQNDSEPIEAECCFEELRSGQVKISFHYPENIEVYFTTDGRDATLASPKYQYPVIVDAGTDIHWLTVSHDNGEMTSNSVTLKRNKNPELVIENNAQFGTMIILEDNKLLSDLPVYYSIIDAKDFYASSQYEMKLNIDWQEYLSPIIITDISYNDFVVAYVIPASDGKLSSDVLYQEFHKIPGSCFNYVFYDKGAYSDGWRYIEICPIEQEGIYGLKGTITTAVESGLGQGVENTNKIASSISNTNSVISESSAAQNALNFVYVNMDDWYLPSIDELKEAKKVYPELFSMFSDYWSSTEKDSEEAYTLRWSRDKDSELKYFVVRRF